ncbi:MAG: competence/damage-inducible protein A [Bryocella sp.]
MIAEIIAIGSEMLTPYRQDTNSLYVTAGLNDLGVEVACKTIMGDNRAQMVAAVRIAVGRADIVVLSGGLGPTEDDLTRECVAEALGLELYRDPTTMTALYKRFAERKTPMPTNNEKQAEVIDGAVLLENSNGSAPGQYLDTTVDGHRKILVLLPGPPTELKAMFDAAVKPRLKATLPARYLARRQLRMALIPESTVDARTAPIYKQFTDVATTILAGHGEIQLHFASAAATRVVAESRVDAVAALVEEEMGEEIYSSNGESLEEIVLLMMEMQGQKLAVAESCTGGLLSQRLTSIVNASRSFHGGAVVYSNEQKVNLCGVPAEMIEEHGAVSEEVARALAEGIRERCHCSLGLSITGIAGPAVTEGPDAGKAVGLVYIGLADGEDTQVKQLNLRGDRDRVRLWASEYALEMLRQRLM